MPSRSEIFNFSPGPAVLPSSVLKQASCDLQNWQSLGYGLVEVSHKSKPFQALSEDLFDRVRRVLGIPDGYEILYMHGGARHHYSMIPMNFLKASAEYADLGVWSRMAYQDASSMGSVSIGAALEGEDLEQHWFNQGDYGFVVDAESIDGLSFAAVDWQTSLPLISDITASCGLRSIDFSKYKMVFASLQKNLGMAGMSMAIVDRAWLSACQEHVPSIWSYQQQWSKDSMLNTPSTMAWYMHHLMLEWIEEMGGVEYFERRQQEWSQALYQLIDEDDFYHSEVPRAFRSPIHVVFHMRDKKTEALFCKQSESSGLIGLKGHKKKGGLRISLYAAQREQALDALLDFMRRFRREHG